MTTEEVVDEKLRQTLRQALDFGSELSAEDLEAIRLRAMSKTASGLHAATAKSRGWLRGHGILDLAAILCIAVLLGAIAIHFINARGGSKPDPLTTPIATPAEEPDNPAPAPKPEVLVDAEAIDDANVGIRGTVVRHDGAQVEPFVITRDDYIAVGGKDVSIKAHEVKEVLYDDRNDHFIEGMKKLEERRAVMAALSFVRALEKAKDSKWSAEYCNYYTAKAMILNENFRGYTGKSGLVYQPPAVYFKRALEVNPRSRFMLDMAVLIPRCLFEEQKFDEAAAAVRDARLRIAAFNRETAQLGEDYSNRALRAVDALNDIQVRFPAGKYDFNVDHGAGFDGTQKSATLKAEVKDSRILAALSKKGQPGRKHYVVLDGSPSSMHTGELLSFEWKQAGGEDLKLPAASLRTARLGLGIYREGRYRFQLVVSIGATRSEPAFVDVQVLSIAKLIELLGADDFLLREKATQALKALGSEYAKEFEAALQKTDDPEIKSRLSRILVVPPAAP